MAHAVCTKRLIIGPGVKRLSDQHVRRASYLKLASQSVAAREEDMYERDLRSTAGLCTFPVSRHVANARAPNAQ